LLIILAVIVLAALKMARQWEQAVVLRAGKFLAVRGPGLFWIIPVLDTVAAMIDTRLRTTQFVAEQTLTKDTVPVDVDAIILWMVTDVRRAALEVASYEEAISWAAQTTLREMIGAADLAMLLSDRKAVDEELRKTIDAKTEEWGIVVKSVEIHDVTIPTALQDAMSREAQAGRERRARRHLGRRRGRDRPQLLPRRRGATPTTQSRSTCVAEHAVRERQRTWRYDDHRAEQRRRQHEPRRRRRHHLTG
jgi:regulator of protease activity HflC (stomatin/prohibitin superfamily)